MPACRNTCAGDLRRSRTGRNCVGRASPEANLRLSAVLIENAKKKKKNQIGSGYLHVGACGVKN